MGAERAGKIEKVGLVGGLRSRRTVFGVFAISPALRAGRAVLPVSLREGRRRKYEMSRPTDML